MNSINVPNLENIAMVSSCIPHCQISTLVPSSPSGPPVRYQPMPTAPGLCFVPEHGDFRWNLSHSMQSTGYHTLPFQCLCLLFSSALRLAHIYSDSSGPHSRTWGKIRPLAKGTCRELATNTVGAKELVRHGSSALGYTYQVPILL